MISDDNAFHVVTTLPQETELGQFASHIVALWFSDTVIAHFYVAKVLSKLNFEQSVDALYFSAIRTILFSLDCATVSASQEMLGISFISQLHVACRSKSF
jgi:hypothetical protein